MHTTRFYGLDFCRAVFMCLGLFFHCGLIYGSGQDWRVLSDETLPVIKYFANFIHHFRMEAFYLVSGFFYSLVFSKKSDGFLHNRITRVLIPMLFVGLTLNFAMNGLSTNRNYQFDLSYFVSGKWLGHLWFLGNLIVYFATSFWLCAWLNRKMGALSQNQFHMLVIALLSIALLGHWIAVSFSLSTVLFINFGYLFYYFPYFLLGIVSFISKSHFFRLIRLRYFLLYLATYAALQATAKIDTGLEEGVIEMFKMISHMLLMLAAFSILNFIGDRESKLVRQFSDASYTIYLLHQPLIIIFYVYFFDAIQLGALVEYCLLISLVLIVSFGFHIAVVKHWTLARFLFNGVLPQMKRTSSKTAFSS